MEGAFEYFYVPMSGFTVLSAAAKPQTYVGLGTPTPSSCRGEDCAGIVNWIDGTKVTTLAEDYFEIMLSVSSYLPTFSG